MRKKVLAALALAATLASASDAQAQCWGVCLGPVGPGPDDVELWTVVSLPVAAVGLTMSIAQIDATGEPSVAGLAGLGFVTSLVNLLLGAYVILEEDAGVVGGINVGVGVAGLVTSGVLAATEVRRIQPAVTVGENGAFVGVTGVTW